MATLGQLVRVRSVLADEVRAYLDRLISDLSELPAYYPDHLKVEDPDGVLPFDAIRQIVQVVDRREFDQWQAKEDERRRAHGEERNDAPRRARPENEGRDPNADADARDSERESEKEPRTVPWDQRAGALFPRAIILGDPAFGKTWILRYEARRLAREALADLIAQTKSLDDLVMPIYSPLPVVAEQPKPLRDRLLELGCAKRLPCFHNFMESKINTRKCVVLLDALDEVAEAERNQVEDRITEFAKDCKEPRILMTCRLAVSRSSPIPGAKELELLAFDWRQIETFVRVWLGPDTNNAAQFLSLLRANPQVRGLARIPLMLALLCRIDSDVPAQYGQGSFPTRRTEIYGRSLWGMLYFWKVIQKRRPNKDAIYLTTLLEGVAYELFASPSKRFTKEFLGLAIANWQPALPETSLLRTTPLETVVQELIDDGVLITAGDDNLAFMHRTMHEYIVSRALAQREDWLKLALERVYDPDWSEVLRLLGGALDAVDEHAVERGHAYRRRAVQYVVELLKKNREDLLCRPLQLAVFAAVEIHPKRMPEKLGEQMRAACLNAWESSPWEEILDRLVTGWGQSIGPDLVKMLRAKNEN